MDFKVIKKWSRRILVGLAIALVVIYTVVATTLYLMDNSIYSGKIKMNAARGESRIPHVVKLLDRGVDSLNERVKLIREAKKSIELEFFIFDLDKSSQLITLELIQKAKQGVDVRILVDFSAPVFRLGPAYAKYLFKTWRKGQVLQHRSSLSNCFSPASQSSQVVDR